MLLAEGPIYKSMVATQAIATLVGIMQLVLIFQEKKI